MIAAPLPPDEDERLRVLQSLMLAEVRGDPVLQGIVRCAARISGCPIAVVSLVEAERQWFPAAVGLTTVQTPRDHAFCAHALRADGLLEVPDARSDPRFHDNPLVTGAPHIVFYAGVPVQAQRHRLGTLCVIDHQPRQLDEATRAALADLGQAVSHWLQARQEQMALARSEARLADFAAAGSDWLWECDADGRFCWVSDGYQRASGQSAAALLGQAVPDLSLCDDTGVPLEPAGSTGRLFAAGQAFSGAIVQREYLSGRHHVALSARPWFGPDGRIAGWRGVAHDVSALVQARRLARDRADLLEKIAGHVPGVIYQFRLDADGRSSFPFASPQLAAVYELSPEAVCEDASLVFGRLHPDDLPLVSASIQHSASRMQVWHQQYRVRLPEAGERWLEGLATPERQADGAVLWHGFITDVTERRAQLQRMQAAEQQRLAAEQARCEQSLFLSRVSHELRTPLNAVLGFTQLMLLDGEHPLAGLQRQRTELVQRGGHYLLTLINDLLELGRLDQGQQPLTLQPVAVRPLVENCLQLLEPLAQRHALRVSFRQRGGEVAAQADPRALEQVLNNLLSNAIKYNRRGGRLRLDVRARHGRVRLAVSDDGAGLSRSRQRELFQPFNRLGAEDSAVEGSGLGLLIAQQLVAGLGGRLRVHSREGRGATFFFTLPLAAGEPAAVVAAPAGPVAGHAPQPATVLYIEDDPVNAQLVQELMAARTPWQLVTASDGPQGLALARRLRPTLVLTDINLPGMDGNAVMRALRADPGTRDIACVALSADAVPDQIARALDAGFDDYLTKPIDLNLLLTRLRTWVERQPSALQVDPRPEPLAA